MPLIKAENLVKSFGPVRAVDGLSVTVNERSVWGLIGPNGAGKTTTIKMILGLSRPDGGQVEVFDEDPWDNPGIRKRIGVIFDRPFFPPHEKALDYLKRACRIYGVPEVRAVEVLKQVDLLDARGRPLKALSMGMLQKFAIAHSMIQSPSLVVADEMTANLDPQTRSRVLDWFYAYQARKRWPFCCLPTFFRSWTECAIIFS